jgi:aminoglycoside phosphotransferase (APT) family kinase protein
MPANSLPPVPYDATAVRPDWADLPGAVRRAIEQRLGAPVTAASSAGGGFTRAFTSVLRTAGGGEAFVKAARLPDQGYIADWYAREAAITAALPATVPAARPRWTLAAEGYFVLCLDPIDGRMPRLPWEPAELAAALDAWATAADALREPPAALLAIGPPRLADLLRADLSWWTEMAAGRAPLPLGAPEDRVHELAALEQALIGYADVPALMHCDLRLDNVLIDPAGRAWICDWNWLCHGPAWFDTATLLITAYASGLDADRLFAEHPTARGAPPDALDGALAALSGYCLTRRGPSDASPHIRTHQWWTGRRALDWLAARRGW